MAIEKKTYDDSISFIRVMAMAFIVICHLGTHFGNAAVGQFFNVGVQIFFLISGYLYGGRIITEPGNWLFKRYIRLEIPALLWLALYWVFAVAGKNPFPAPHQIAFILLNLEGLDFILSAMPGDIVIGPWFFTNIMACYILFLLYQRLEEKHAWAGRIFSYGGVIPLAVFALLGMLQVSTDGALAFFMGVTLKRRGLLKSHRKYNIFVAIGTFAVAVGLRIICKKLFDDTVFYREIISPGTHVMIAGAFLVGVKWLFSVADPFMNGITENRFFQHLDRISIYMYVCHGFFIEPVFNELMPQVGVIAFVAFLCLALLISTVLWLVGEWITKEVERGVYYLFG